ncbi:hypothetical protein BDW62DRAFT_171931 [Aspergillus aurantiobrunneus]
MPDQLQRQGFRSIAPKGTEFEIEPPTTSRSHEDNRTKRASTACGECKQRRTKCTVDDAGTSCTECALHNRECIIDELADKRRKVAARETAENLRKTQGELAIAQGELNYYRSYVRYLLNAIRFCELADVDELVAVIRNGSTDEQIQTFLAQFAHIFPEFSLRTSHGSHSMDGADGTPDGNGSLRP